MADKKTSELPAVVTPATTDLVAVVQGGADKKETLEQIGEALGLSVTTVEAIVLALIGVADQVTYVSITADVNDGEPVISAASSNGGFQHSMLGIASLGQRGIRFSTNSTHRWNISGGDGSLVDALGNAGSGNINQGGGQPVYSFIGSLSSGLGETAADTPAVFVSAVPVTKWTAAGISIVGGSPASATAPGVTGTVIWDASFIYVCVATDTWTRAALSTW